MKKKMNGRLATIDGTEWEFWDILFQLFVMKFSQLSISERIYRIRKLCDQFSSVSQMNANMIRTLRD